jgi:hypothetical protein
VELAETGDVILVSDGRYPVGLREDTVILDIPGVTLAAENIGGATLVPVSEDWSWLSGIYPRADDIIIDGFAIEGFRRGYGVYFGRLDRPQRNLVLRHLKIKGVSDGIRSAIPDGSINTQPVIQGLLLYDIELRDIGVVGFNCGEGPCQDVRIEALSVTTSSAASGSGADAVAVENGDNIIVFNAEVAGAAADGLDFKATRVAIANVVVHDVGRNGIKLWHGGDVINALIYNTGADGAIILDGAGEYRILHTTVARHRYGGSSYAGTAAYDHPQDPGRLTILNSIFFENAGALWVSGAFDLDVRRTLFYGSSNGQELIWALPEELVIGELAEPLSALEKSGGGTEGLDFVDPGFVNPDAGDYRLTRRSPARDRGLITEGLPPFDLLGRPRIEGTAADLGPLEKTDKE